VVGCGDRPLRVGGEFFAPSLIVEQEQPLAADEPVVRTSRDRQAAGDADRIVAAELRHINIGPRGKRLLVPDVAEAPDGATVAQFEIWRPAIGLPSVKKATGS